MLRGPAIQSDYWDSLKYTLVSIGTVIKSSSSYAIKIYI